MGEWSTGHLWGAWRAKFIFLGSPRVSSLFSESWYNRHPEQSAMVRSYPSREAEAGPRSQGGGMVVPAWAAQPQVTRSPSPSLSCSWLMKLASRVG